MLPLTLFNTYAQIRDKDKSLHFVDGGAIDTTSIVQLLRVKTASIVAFYNNHNGGLGQDQAMFAYLFGIGDKTDDQNSLIGPQDAHVFNSTLYPDVIFNLTANGTEGVENPGIAHLKDVRVLENAYLGVEEYMLDDLVIFSNTKQSAFAAEFTGDASISEALKKDLNFPDKLPTGMSTFEANALCLRSAWDIHRYTGELKRIFGA